MPHQRLILALPRTLQHWKWLLLIITGFSVVAKLIIHSVGAITGTVLMAIPLWQGMMISFMYSSMIIITQLVTAEFAEYMLPLKNRRAVVVHILIQSCSAVVGFLLSREAEKLIFGTCLMPDRAMIIVMSVSFGLALVGNAGYYLYSFYSNLRIAEQLVVESEIKALRAQINPHFLFNTLNSIAALIRIRPDEAEFVTQQLADLFRYSLRSSKQSLVSVADEIGAVELYLSIEKARFRERLNIEIEIPQPLESLALPSMLLQPLVENAIKHGINTTEEAFAIRVIATRTGDTLMLGVYDTGEGFNLTHAEKYFSKGTGLSNVRERLQLLFPRGSNVTIVSNGVEIYCPCRELQTMLVEPYAISHVIS
jgi:two-component system, LytTR family, sensor histidine kinase AlgZ